MKLLISSKKIAQSILLLCALSASVVPACAQTIHTFAGNGIPVISGDGGPATAASLNEPQGIAIDVSGNIYIADHDGEGIRKVNTSGIISTFAGFRGVEGFSGDGGAATAAELAGPTYVTVDDLGNVYFSDQGNNRIRKINTSGIISTIAGNGAGGYSGDGGAATAAAIGGPQGIAVDGAGNVYFADRDDYRIRKVNTSGIISTIAGNGSSGFSGDGGAATAAAIGWPFDIAFDVAGDLYISDINNNIIRKINSAGIISTIAGNDTAGYSGDGGPATAAELNGPMGITFDAAGNIYISDWSNNRVRKINTSGVITTYAGNGTPTFGGDGAAATAAMLREPTGLATDAVGNLYIADRSNFRVRIVTPLTTPVFDSGSTQDITLCESSGANAINSLLMVTDIGTGLTETYSVTVGPVHGAITAGSTVASGTSVSPTGWDYTPTTGYTGTDSFTIQVSNGSNTASTTIYVTVNPLPVTGSISGSHSICPGSTETLAVAFAGGTWSDASIGVATISGSSGLTISAAGVAAGTDTIYYSVTNSCGTATAYTVVTVDALPDAGTITGTSTLCMGASGTLSDAAAGGVWSAGTTGIATVSGSGGGTTTVTGIAAGIDTIYYSVTTSCGTAVAAYTINVLGVPVVASITGADTVCIASSAALTDVATGGTWASNSPSVATIDATGVVTPVTTGTDSIVYSVDNGCSTTTVTHRLVIDSLPSVAPVTGPDAVCKDSTLQFMDVTLSGLWSTSAHGSIVAATGMFTGSVVGADTVWYTVSNLCGTSTESTIISVVNCDTLSHVGVANLPGIVAGLYITPNPSDGHFTLRLAYPASETSTIAITDMLGKRLNSFDLPTNTEHEVKINLPAGSYIMSGRVRNEQFSGRLVIE